MHKKSEKTLSGLSLENKAQICYLIDTEIEIFSIDRATDLNGLLSRQGRVPFETIATEALNFGSEEQGACLLRGHQAVPGRILQKER